MEYANGRTLFYALLLILYQISTRKALTLKANREKGFPYVMARLIHSTVTDFAKFLGWSTSFPLSRAMW